MTARWFEIALVFGGVCLVGLTLVVVSAVSPVAALALAPVLAAGSLVMLRPFVGVALLVLLAQLDTVATMASQALPVSVYKLLTAATLASILVNGYSIERSRRFGPDTFPSRAAVLFGLWMLLSFLVSVYKGPGKDYLLGLLSVMVLFYLVVVSTDSIPKLEVLVWSLVLAGLVSAGVVIFDTMGGTRLLSTEVAAVTAQWEGQARSAGASDYNPTTAAHMLLASTVLASVMFVETRRFRAVSGLAALLGTAALVLTFARSASIAYGLTLLVFIVANRRHRLFPLWLMVGLIAAASAIPFIPANYWERMGTLFNFDSDRTLWRRLSYNQIGLRLLADHPFLGVGPGNFPFHYISPDFRWYPGRLLEPRHLHNSYLGVAAETGLIGIACFMAVIMSSLRMAVGAARSGVEAMRPAASALGYAFFAFLIASAFMPNEDTKFMWLLAGLCCAAGLLAKRAGKDWLLPRQAAPPTYA